MRATLALLFFVSGFAGLVLQTVWTRMMILVFGSTTFAVSTVLTAFMAGLAGGSWLAGRRGRWLVTRRRAVWVYALLELGIGLYALALPWLLHLLPALQRALLGDDPLSSFYLFALLRFLLVALLLAPPTLAMGATLPVLARAFCRPARDDERAAATGRDVGTLYALNTAGAVAGVLAAGFVLLPAWGAMATSLTACATDLLLGAVALLLARGWTAGDEATSSPASPASSASASAPEGARSTLPTVALVCIGVSGAVAMSLEVALTRALSLVIGSSTYAFSLILLCFLVGLAGGAALYARRQTAAGDQAGNLAVAYLMAGVTLTGSLLLVDDLPALMLVALQRVALSPEGAFLLKFALAGLVLLLPTLFLGMVFPAVVRIYAGRGGSPTATTATVYVSNTVGAIVGSFLGGYALVPLLGLQRGLELLVLATLGLAALVACFAASRPKRLVVWGVAALAATGPWLLPRWSQEAMSAGVFRVSRSESLLRSADSHDRLSPQAAERRQAWLEVARRALPRAAAVGDSGWEPTAGTRLVWQEEGLAATVGISRTVDRALAAGRCWVRHTLLVNGKPDASLSVLRPRPSRGCGSLFEAGAPRGPGLAVSPAGDAETQVLSGVLPTLLHPGRVRRALVIGWGSGVTVGAMRAAGVPRVTAVELERRVIDASRYFEPHNGSPRSDPGVTIVADDGRSYLGWNPARYDVVVSEPSNPWIAGCGNLFTREFFQLVRRRLAPGGILLQWLQAYEIAPANVWTILATVSSVFESVHVFAPVRPEADLLLVAQGPTRALDWPRIARRVEALAGQLAQFGLRGPADLAARAVASPPGVAQLGRGATLNTDDNARIEFSTPRDLVNYHRYSPRKIIARMRATVGDPLGLFGDSEPADARAALCWAMLAAGRLEGAQQAARRAGSPGERCRRVGRLLARPLAELTLAELSTAIGEGSAKQLRSLPRDRRAARAELLLDPGTPSCAALWVLGRLHAADDRHGTALTLLQAAAAKAGRPAQGCPPAAAIHRALARQSHRVGLHLPALKHARQGLDE